MKVQAIKTKIVKEGDDLLKLMQASVNRIEERSVLVITSKIVSIMEGNTKSLMNEKEDLIKQESEKYLGPDKNKYGVSLTIKNSRLIPMAGIDESNANGKYILWPVDPWKSVNTLRNKLMDHYKLKEFGVILSDSTVGIMQWGTVGTAIAYSGFEPLKSYIGEKDLFGRKMEYSTLSIANGLAASAVVTMGEGNEQKPLALISDIDFVDFVERDTSPEDIKKLEIKPEDDLFGHMLSKIEWE